ncbi:MAG: hypothetical protein JL50_11670 [Peptococcaceae bacterium BICA1-7]|nr:MAG: hypothetical protein JL50_11670 [Peptococcaceae bacterium BICA1-7]HBV98779.1 hypothetical protein [Desulfotomaculum sp.]
MNKLFVSIAAGAAAGVTDIIPMLFQRLDWYSVASAFFHWVITGFIIFHLQILRGWLLGLIIGEITAVPIMILVFQKDPSSIIPIIIFSAVLGSILGLWAERYSYNY